MVSKRQVVLGNHEAIAESLNRWWNELLNIIDYIKDQIKAGKYTL